MMLKHKVIKIDGTFDIVEAIGFYLDHGVLVFKGRYAIIRAYGQGHWVSIEPAGTESSNA